jgi:hypothetical protein
MSTELLPNSTEKAENQIAVVEINASRLPTTVDAMKKLGAMRIEIPDSLKKKAKGAVLASTLAVSGAFMLGNPDKAFAQTQGDAPKVEQTQNAEMFDIQSLTPSARDKLIKLRVSNSSLNKKISDATIKSQSSLVPKELIPQSVLETQETSDNIKKIQAETESIKSQTAEIEKQTESIRSKKASEAQRQIEQPVQVPQPPKNDGFPFLPLAILTAGVIGGLNYAGKEFDKALKKEALENNKTNKVIKGNAQFGMPNKDPYGTDSLELTDKIAEQKLKLQQSEQAEFLVLQDLAILEQALELAVQDGLSPNSIAYKKGKQEIEQKKSDINKKYLS